MRRLLLVLALFLSACGAAPPPAKAPTLTPTRTAAPPTVTAHPVGEAVQVGDVLATLRSVQRTGNAVTLTWNLVNKGTIPFQISPAMNFAVSTVDGKGFPLGGGTITLAGIVPVDNQITGVVSFEAPPNSGALRARFLRTPAGPVADWNIGSP